MLILKEKIMSLSYLKLIMHECFTKLGVVVAGIESEPEPFTPSAREQPPAIARPITNTLVVEGSPAKFVAEYTGEPTPQVTWLRNALQILQETRDIKVIGGCYDTGVIVITLKQSV